MVYFMEGTEPQNPNQFVSELQILLSRHDLHKLDPYSIHRIMREILRGKGAFLLSMKIVIGHFDCQSSPSLN